MRRRKKLRRAGGWIILAHCWKKTAEKQERTPSKEAAIIYLGIWFSNVGTISNDKKLQRIQAFYTGQSLPHVVAISEAHAKNSEAAQIRPKHK